MLLLTIEKQLDEPVESLLNVKVDESATVDDMRAAWESVLNGTLEKHLFDALFFECVKRRIDPYSVVPKPSAN